MLTYLLRRPDQRQGASTILALIAVRVREHAIAEGEGLRLRDLDDLDERPCGRSCGECGAQTRRDVGLHRYAADVLCALLWTLRLAAETAPRRRSSCATSCGAEDPWHKCDVPCAVPA